MSLRPFLHEHHLLFDEYEKQESCCDKCNQQIDGWAFTCETCKFWLHHSCAVQQLPLEISHHLHPQHPLTLVTEKSSDYSYFFCNGCSSLTRSCLYRCQDCNFNLDHICASSATITSHRYKEINHFCHYHSLTLFKYRKVGKYHYSCFWCEKLLFGVSYGCFECPPSESFVHETCLINLPNIISKHHFHPSHQLQLKVFYVTFPCNVCGYIIWNNPQGCFCEKCQFFVHFCCAKFKPSLKHELHDHRLTLLPMKPEPYELELEPCKKCKEKIHPIEGSVYNYYVHKTCIRWPSQVLHPLHPQHSLKLIPRYEHTFICPGCRDLNRGFAYICSVCDFMMDVKCATSSWGPKNETQRLKDMDTHPKLCLFNPHHSLEYAIVPSNLLGFAGCGFCGLYLSGPTYVCSECRYSLHGSCIDGIPGEMQIQFHPQHPLHLLFNQPQDCRACKESLEEEISYGCEECDLYLHPYCAKSFKQVLKPKSHPHHL